MSFHFNPIHPHPQKEEIYNSLREIPIARKFLSWAQYLKIMSKDEGVVDFSPNLWFLSQWIFIHTIFTQMDKVKWFLFLKGRQEGITTVAQALDLFWAFIHPNIMSSLVSADYKISNKMRQNFKTMFANLPARARQTKIQHNAELFSFKNGSFIDYLFLTSRNGARGNMGRSGAHNYAHLTEVAFFPQLEDYNAFIDTLSYSHPFRLYIFESTANGYNHWHEMWEVAKESETQAAVFLGWWTKETYRLEEPGQYGYAPVGWERENVDLVKKLYGFDLDIKQIAWWRKHAKEEVSDRGLMSREDVCLQEYPWTEFDSWRLSGKKFFQARLLQDLEEQKIPPIKCLQPQMKPGKPEETQFLETPAGQIKIWEPYEPEGVYILGGDPSYGANPESDNAVIEIFKAHKDKLIQVVEYADNIVDTQHFSWILISLAGMWSAPQIIEVNGPGRAVIQYIDNYKRWIKEGEKDLNERMTVFDYAKKLKAEYIYHRPDILGIGNARHWQTTPATKEPLMFQFQSSFHNGEIIIRSKELTKEMEYIEQAGGAIGATEGKNDDRVIASALVCEFWTKMYRPRLPSMEEYQERLKLSAKEKEVYNSPKQAFMQDFVRQIIANGSAHVTR